MLIKTLLVQVSGCSSGVERNLAKVEVAGSSPVSRSSKKSTPVDFFILENKNGAVPKWLKGKVCKTFIRRFESDRRLHKAVLIVVHLFS